KRKLPSMYHQFKELGGIDITKEPMEVGPTTHYVMGGVRVDAETQMSKVPGLFACGECAVGINGANRLGGHWLSGLVVVGKRAGEGGGGVGGRVWEGARRRDGPRRPGDGGGAVGAGAVRAAGRQRGAVPGPAGLAGDDAGPGGHRASRGGDDAGPGGAGEVAG